MPKKDRSKGYNDSIFVNCPFDNEYAPLLKAIVFTIYRCGFLPKSALGEDNALDNRLDKIVRLTEECRFGIHDISRTELNKNSLPRFNMPFELGLFFGAKRFGSKIQNKKNALIFERVKNEYQGYISDIKGVDTKAHHNDPEVIIKTIRDWLKSSSRRISIPGYSILIDEYKDFLSKLPAIATGLGFNIDDIPFNDYCTIVEDVIYRKLN